MFYFLLLNILRLLRNAMGHVCLRLFSLYFLPPDSQYTCTVLNLLFHLSPSICTSIVFRDTGIVM